MLTSKPVREAARHLLQRTDHVRVARDHGAAAPLRVRAPASSGTHHVEVQLLHAERQEQRREVRHRLVVRADDAHVDGDALALACAAISIVRRMRPKEPSFFVVRSCASSVRALDRDAEGEELRWPPVARISSMKPSRAVFTPLVKMTISSKPEGDGVSDEVEEPRLERRLAAEERDLGVPLGVGLGRSPRYGGEVERSGATEARSLAARRRRRSGCCTCGRAGSRSASSPPRL